MSKRGGDNFQQILTQNSFCCCRANEMKNSFIITSCSRKSCRSCATTIVCVRPWVRVWIHGVQRETERCGLSCCHCDNRTNSKAAKMAHTHKDLFSNALLLSVPYLKLVLCVFHSRSIFCLSAIPICSLSLSLSTHSFTHSTRKRRRGWSSICLSVRVCVSRRQFLLEWPSAIRRRRFSVKWSYKNFKCK